MFDYTVKIKGGTVIGSMPTGMTDIQLKLLSIGVALPPDRVYLRYGENEELRARVTGTNESSMAISKLLTEDNTLADANMLSFVLEGADRYARSEIDRKVAEGQYASIQELMTDALQMKLAPDVTETFYFPLTGEMEEGEEEEFLTVPDSMLLANEAIISRALAKEQRGPEREMAQYFSGDVGVENKLVSSVWSVEELDGTLYGKCEVTLRAPLTEPEMEALREWITGQNSDGLGEGFEQHPIRTEEGDLYVSMWNSGEEYFVRTRDEMDRSLDRTCTEGMSQTL